MNMYQFLSNGGLSKMLSLILIFVFTLGAGGIVGWEYLNNVPVSLPLIGFIGVVLGHIVTLLTNVQSTSNVDHVANTLNQSNTQAVSNAMTSPSIANNTQAVQANTQAMQANTQAKGVI